MLDSDRQTTKRRTQKGREPLLGKQQRICYLSIKKQIQMENMGLNKQNTRWKSDHTMPINKCLKIQEQCVKNVTRISNGKIRNKQKGINVSLRNPDIGCPNNSVEQEEHKYRNQRDSDVSNKEQQSSIDVPDKVSRGLKRKQVKKYGELMQLMSRYSKSGQIEGTGDLKDDEIVCLVEQQLEQMMDDVCTYGGLPKLTQLDQETIRRSLNLHGGSDGQRITSASGQHIVITSRQLFQLL